MYHIWFEREMDPQFAPLLEGIAEPIGPAGGLSVDPLAMIGQADGVVASQLVYDGALMDQAPKLKVISRTGIGYEKVSIPEATARGIAVCNAPDGPTISTAEHTILLILATAKKLKEAERRLREEVGDYYRNHTGLELHGLTLGLVGFGRIGRHVARVAQALGMRVLAYDPYVSVEQATALQIQLVATLDALLPVVDVLSLHVPLFEETHQMMNTARFAQMKSGAIFINAARGGLVDEAALLAALDNGQLFAAGLDVTEPEPPQADNPLLHRDDVVVTPHIASATRTAKHRINETAIRQVVQVLKGERPPHLLNPEVWKGR